MKKETFKVAGGWEDPSENKKSH